MWKQALSLLAIFIALKGNTQSVAINENAANADASAMLDVSSKQKGILIPRLTTQERNLIVTPATALLIFNTDVMQFQVNTGSAAQPLWQNIVTQNQPDAAKNFWLTGGNRNLHDTSFIGTADNKPLSFKTNNLLRLYIDSTTNKIGIGTSSPRTALDIATTDALIVPVGTTAQRPAQPVIGMIRFNAGTSKLEGYTNTGWVALH
jgi:hypothetical protein